MHEFLIVRQSWWECGELLIRAVHVINLYYGSAIVVNQLVLILLSYSMTGLVLLERMGYERFRAAA